MLHGSIVKPDPPLDGAENLRQALPSGDLIWAVVSLARPLLPFLSHERSQRTRQDKRLTGLSFWAQRDLAGSRDYLCFLPLPGLRDTVAS